MTKAAAIKKAATQGHTMSAFSAWGRMPRSYNGAATGRIGLYEAICLTPGCPCVVGIRGDGYVYKATAFDAPCAAQQ